MCTTIIRYVSSFVLISVVIAAVVLINNEIQERKENDN